MTCLAMGGEFVFLLSMYNGDSKDLSSDPIPICWNRNGSLVIILFWWAHGKLNFL